MLKCRDIHDQASSFLEGQMAWTDRMKFRLHVLICHHCRHFLRQLAASIRLMGMRQESTSSEAIDEQVSALMRARSNSEKSNQ